MPTVDDINRLKNEVDELTRRKERTAGIISEMRKKSKYAADAAALKKHLDVLQKKRRDKEAEFQKLLAKYVEKHRDGPEAPEKGS